MIKFFFYQKVKLLLVSNLLTLGFFMVFKNLDKIAKFQNVTIRQNYTFLSRIFLGKPTELYISGESTPIFLQSNS